jgi:CysZ protein
MEYQASTKVGFVTAFLNGFRAPFSSIKIIKEHKRLLSYFIIPFILNIILLFSVFIICWLYLIPFIHGIMPAGQEWYYKAIRFVIKHLMVLLLFILGALFYSISGSIIISPFNDLLSARVETLLTGVKFDEKFSFSHLIDDFIRIIFNIVKLLAIIIIFNVLIFCLNIIPLAGSVLYSILSFMSAMFFLGFQFFDFPLERRRLRFGDKLRVLLKNKFMTIGLGAGFLVISFIPFLGFLGLNLGSIGATRLFVEYIKPSMKIDK